MDYIYSSDQSIDIASYLQERVILAPTLDVVDSINQYIVSLNENEGQLYLSLDMMCKAESTNSILQDVLMYLIMSYF